MNRLQEILIEILSAKEERAYQKARKTNNWGKYEKKLLRVGKLMETVEDPFKKDIKNNSYDEE